jgi:hypothetical protein
VSHKLVLQYYYGVLEYVAGSQNVGLEGRDQECARECVASVACGLGFERAAHGLPVGSERAA